MSNKNKKVKGSEEDPKEIWVCQSCNAEFSEEECLKKGGCPGCGI